MLGGVALSTTHARRSMTQPSQMSSTFETTFEIGRCIKLGDPGN